MALKYYLGWFQQNFDNIEVDARDTVRVNVRSYDTDRKRIIGGEDVSLSNSKLTEHAKADGRTTWDEADVAAEAAKVLKVSAVAIPATFDPDSSSPA